MFIRICILLCVSVILGCSSEEDPQILAQRARFLLEQEPEGEILGVLDARELDVSLDEVLIVGKIGSNAWHPGKASFEITDPSASIEDDHDHAGHDPSTCKFCQAKENGEEAPSPKAIIQFLDDQHNVLNVDAQKLLGLEQGQTVVVRGKGHIDTKLGSLIVIASGVYIRS